MKKSLVLLLLCFSSYGFSQNKILDDSLYIEELRQHINTIYNFDFSKSETIYNGMLSEHPNHPFPDLYYSLVIYWKYFPVTTGTKNEALFLNYLNKSISKADSYFEKNKNLESIFFNLIGRMFIMQYFADNQASSNVISHIKPSYNMLVKGFKLENSFSDFKFSSGVYNYYREYYPEAHPIYKPIAYFFPEGNAIEGIKKLEFNSKNGVFLHKESLAFLVYINLYFEKNYKMALKYSKPLSTENPNNLLYQTYYIQNLLLLKKYDAAKEILPILESSNHTNDFFKAVANIFQGIIYEKKAKNFNLAKLHYKKGLTQLNKFGVYANTYNSIAYYGLSRIYSTSHKKKSKHYRKEADKRVIFPHINFD